MASLSLELAAEAGSDSSETAASPIACWNEEESLVGRPSKHSPRTFCQLRRVVPLSSRVMAEMAGGGWKAGLLAGTPPK